MLAAISIAGIIPAYIAGMEITNRTTRNAFVVVFAILVFASIWALFADNKSDTEKRKRERGELVEEMGRKFEENSDPVLRERIAALTKTVSAQVMQQYRDRAQRYRDQ
jgi:hypothetical protein